MMGRLCAALVALVLAVTAVVVVRGMPGPVARPVEDEPTQTVPVVPTGTPADAALQAQLEARMIEMQEVLKERPDDVASWLALGDAQLRLGFIAESRTTFEHAHALDPRNPSPLYGLAETCRIVGDRRAEIAAYRSILDLKPDDQAIHQKLATAAAFPTDDEQR